MGVFSAEHIPLLARCIFAFVPRIMFERMGFGDISGHTCGGGWMGINMANV